MVGDAAHRQAGTLMDDRRPRRIIRITKVGSGRRSRRGFWPIELLSQKPLRIVGENTVVTRMDTEWKDV